MIPSMQPSGLKNIWTVEGRGWREVYEVMPNGDKVLLWSNSDKPEDWNKATAVTVAEEMPWSDFCRRFRDNPSYRKPATP
jgi:hypothetical protein